MLGVLVFVVVAIGLGWGLVRLFQARLDQTTHTLHGAELDHGFDPDVVYTLKRDLLLGYLADGRVVLLPGRDDLPRHAPGRRSAARVEDVRANPEDFPDLIGVVERNTAVRFVEVIDDRENPQTRILLRAELLGGRYARPQPVLGMHLESVDTGGEGDSRRYVPRPDLFEQAPAGAAPVQSPPQPTDPG